MTKKEIEWCEKTIKELMTLERENQYHPQLSEKIRFVRIVVMKMMNNLNYRVSIPEPGVVHVFRGDAS